MPNKFKQWKEKQKPRISTNNLAHVLGTTPGWVSTLLNQNSPSRNKGRRCGFDLAVKIEVLTKGEVTITDMMMPAEEIAQIEKEIKKKAAACN